jgi:hypothetical protein
MASMKSNVLKANKSAVSKQKKVSSSDTAVMRRKVKQTFADQVEAFVEGYRPAMKALANE